MRITICILAFVAYTYAENQSVASTTPVQVLYQTPAPHHHQVEVQRTTLQPQPIIQPHHEPQVQEQPHQALQPQIETQLHPQSVEPPPPQVNYYQPLVLPQFFRQPIEPPQVHLQAIRFYIQPQFQQQLQPEPTEEHVQIPFQPHLQAQQIDKEQQHIEPVQLQLQPQIEPQIQEIEQERSGQGQPLQPEPQAPEAQPSPTPPFPTEYTQIRHIKLPHERYSGFGGLILKTPQEEYLDTFAPPPHIEYLSPRGHTQQQPLPLIQDLPSLQKLFIGPRFIQPTLYQPRLQYRLPIPEYEPKRILREPAKVDFQQHYLLRNEIEQSQQVTPAKEEREFLKPSHFGGYANEEKNHETKAYLPQQQSVPLQYRPVYFLPKENSFSRRSSLPGGYFPRHFVYQLSHIPRLFFP